VRDGEAALQDTSQVLQDLEGDMAKLKMREEALPEEVG
jgi:hypothetical protein